MSSTNALGLLDPSSLNAVHPILTNGNDIVGAQQTTIVHDNDGNTHFQDSTVQMTTGAARDTSISTTTRNNYPARYNFAVRQYNGIPDDGVPRKKQMRGGHFLMYRWIVIPAFLIAVVAAGISLVIKPFVALNIGLSLIYIILSIYNIIIFKRNGNLFSHRMIHDNNITLCNKYYTVPIHTSVRLTNIIGSQHEDILAGLRNVYNHLSEIQVMVYNGDYVRKYTYFPRSSVIHLIAFLLVMILGIILASIIKVQTSQI